LNFLAVNCLLQNGNETKNTARSSKLIHTQQRELLAKSLAPVVPDNMSSTRDDFDFMERAGRGASSVVFKARRKADGKVYCVKEIDMSAVVPEEEEQALREVQLLASFEHPYVIRYYDSFLDDEILHIVMEWAEHGTLADRLKATGAFVLYCINKYV